MMCLIFCLLFFFFFFFQAEDGIRDLVRSRGLGDVYKRQEPTTPKPTASSSTSTDTASLPLRCRDIAENAVEVTRLRATQDSTATAAATGATRRARTEWDQVMTVAITRIAVTTAGTLTRADTSRPRTSCPRGTANVANREGSRVSSTPKAMTGKSAQPRVSTLPPMMTTVRATSLGTANLRAMSPETATARTLRPYSPPRISPTS